MDTRTIKVSTRAFDRIKALAAAGRWTMVVAADMAVFPEERPGGMARADAGAPPGPFPVSDWPVRELTVERDSDQAEPPVFVGRGRVPLDPTTRDRVPKLDTPETVAIKARRARSVAEALVTAIPGLTTAGQLTKRRGSVAVAPPEVGPATDPEEI